MTSSRTFALLAALAGVAAGPQISCTFSSPLAVEEPASRSLRCLYTAVVREVPETAEQAFLWIPYPPSNEDQTVSGVEVKTSLPYEMVSEPKHGNRAFRFALPAGLQDMRVAVQFDVLRRERINRPGSASGSLTVAAMERRLPGSRNTQLLPTGVDIWLQPDRRVPTDGLIRRWAEETVQGEVTLLGKARRIYDYAVTELTYDKSGTGWGEGDIYWACDARRGNCTDFHALFIGYSRAVGIPARFEMGYPVPVARGSGEVAGYHCWAQFYIPGEGWVPVDASEANKNPDRRDYFFGAHDENRVLFTVGRDLTFPGMGGEPLNFFIYPYVEIDGEPAVIVERRFTYQDIDS